MVIRKTGHPTEAELIHELQMAVDFFAPASTRRIPTTWSTTRGGSGPSSSGARLTHARLQQGVTRMNSPCPGPNTTVSRPTSLRRSHTSRRAPSGSSSSSCPAGRVMWICSSRSRSWCGWRGSRFPSRSAASRRSATWRRTSYGPRCGLIARTGSAAGKSPTGSRTSRRARTTFACCAAATATASRTRSRFT